MSGLLWPPAKRRRPILLELLLGLEPRTSSLPRRCSTTELQQRLWSDDRAPGSTTPCSRKAGAGRGNRTLTTSLEGWGSTIELHPQLKRAESSNLIQSQKNERRTTLSNKHFRKRPVVGRTGFEPVKAVPSDLQSDPVDRLGICPQIEPPGPTRVTAWS